MLSLATRPAYAVEGMAEGALVGSVGVGCATARAYARSKQAVCDACVLLLFVCEVRFGGAQ